MHPVLNKNLFIIKEQVGLFKSANSYDILDPETGEEIIHCREPNLGQLTRMLRFSRYKTCTPFNIQMTTPSGDPVLQVKRGISIFLSKVDVLDADGNRIGGFKQKFWSLGGAFKVLGADDEELCTLQGNWSSWNFRFVKGDQEFAKVSKEWAGLGKELFTTADNYVLQIADAVPENNPVRQLIMAAVMCIDMVLKEG